MGPDDKICYCYHVSLRKLRNFALRTKPARASQMSECLGAGTGCGWCIPMLKKIHDEAVAGGEGVSADLVPDQYAADRQAYIQNEALRNRFEDSE
jgi:bacterioferritin-associated ferredoxin